MFNNKDYQKEYQKKYYQEHKEKYYLNQKEWRKTHKEQNLETSRKYIRKNKNKIKKYLKEWYESHKERIRKRYIVRLRVDLNFKLSHYLRKRIWSALKENHKSESVLKLLGCSLEFLKSYLERQFKPGMLWNNYGKWHVDHIRPCASFDLSKESEQCKCFNYKNIQPLWAKDNLAKQDKIIIKDK